MKHLLIKYWFIMFIYVNRKYEVFNLRLRFTRVEILIFKYFLLYVHCNVAKNILLFND